MIRMTVAKWLAAAVIGLSVPTIGLSQHTDTLAGTAMESVGAAKALSTGTTSGVKKTKHHSKKLSHTRSHTKHKALHSRHHKAKKLTTTKHVAS